MPGPPGDRGPARPQDLSSSCTSRCAAEVAPRRRDDGAPRPLTRRPVNGVASRMALHGALCDDSPMPTVLIVDDHPSFRASAQAILEAEGFEVVGEAEDGESAIEASHRLRPGRRPARRPAARHRRLRGHAPPDLERRRPLRRARLEPRRERLRAARRGQRCLRVRPEERALLGPAISALLK